MITGFSAVFSNLKYLHEHMAIKHFANYIVMVIYLDSFCSASRKNYFIYIYRRIGDSVTFSKQNLNFPWKA
jgi:hypothetical protein